MKWVAAFIYLKRGHDMKLPEWEGKWSWNKTNQSIDIHTRDGRVFDIRDTNDVDYTFSFLGREDWELADKNFTDVELGKDN